MSSFKQYFFWCISLVISLDSFPCVTFIKSKLKALHFRQLETNMDLALEGTKMFKSHRPSK